MLMDGGSKFFYGLCGAGVLIALAFIAMTAHSVGRESVEGACKRDGFFWIYGTRYECRATKPENK